MTIVYYIVSNFSAPKVDSDVQNVATIEVTASHDGDCIRVHCTFMDASTNQCMAVVTERAQKYSKYGLLNISVYSFSRDIDGDTAGGCLLGSLNVNEFNIDVFPLSGKKITGMHIEIKSIIGKSIYMHAPQR